MLGPHTGLPASLPLFRSLCKILCWDCHKLTCYIFLNLIHSLKSSISKVILVLGKARSHKLTNLGCRGLSHLGDVMFRQNVCTRFDTWAGTLLWWSCQSPVARSCSHFSWIASPNWQRTLRQYSLLLVWSEGAYSDGQQLPNQKTQLTWSWSCCNFSVPSSGVENQATSIRTTGPPFLDHSHRPTIHL